MTIGTTRFFGNNSELFSKLNTELQSLQTQAGTGKAELKLANNISDISKLSAAEEKKSETNQLLSNSQRAQTDLEVMDVAFERIQNLLVRLQELAVESANDTLTPEERKRFVGEASMLKSELVDVANQKDNFGNSLFGGVSGVERPFQNQANGTVKYSGSSLAKEIHDKINLINVFTEAALPIIEEYIEYSDGEAVSYTHLTLPTNREV